MDQIMDLCQLANFKKVQKLTKLGAKSIYQSIDIDKELESGKSTEYISTKYLFKLANTLNDFISLKDNYTRVHCERVANYAEALGHALDMNEKELENLILAANLHDIGKIALPDAVITKTEKLNDMEFGLMKKHVELSSLLLPGNELGFLRSTVRAHHEKYDGSGYPDGLKSNQIPQLAQILAIADSF
ncbi:MAG: HD domain-containing protein [Bacilli bacterium]|nr:HD domain-containing protein [Bacilli bacterium]